MRRASSPPLSLSPVAQAARRLVLCAALGVSYTVPGHAQAPAGSPAPAPTPMPAPSPAMAEAGSAQSPAQLKGTPQLAEKVPGTPGSEGPTFMFGDRLSGRPDLETVIEGNAEVRRGATSIRADRIEYYQPDDLMKSRGNVRINNAGNRFDGPELEIQLDRFEGFFTQPTYRFLSNGGNGQAERVDFIDNQHMTARRATYTTCERGNEASWQPDWVLRASRVDFDFDKEVGVATGAVLRFKNVPILGFPKVSFPLSDKRKSGLLPPTINVGTVNGFEIRQPYYFDIAPNRDATFSPAIMTKRGIDYAGEFRYLDPRYRGILRANVLPGDKLRDRDRWSYGLQHTGTVDTGIQAIGDVGLNLNLNRVSDQNYWRDLTASGNSLTPRLFAQDASVTWGRGYFSAAARTLKWQTLQDISAPITPPYDRLPQFTANYTRVDAPLAGLGNGFDWSLEGDYTRFEADRALTGQPNSNRAFSRAQLARPWLFPAGFITPKVQLHATRYEFDAPLGNGLRTASRVVPTFSLDTGLQFERNARAFGRSFTQTLEPRAFYVRTPFRDQSLLPNYDSAATDFNFATVFTENAFVGNDRISDANLLTLGVTSRLLNPATGGEAVRFGVAQRLRFEDQKVTLPGVLPTTDRVSDLLVGTSVNWVPQWSFDGAVQFNPKTSQSERSAFAVRYNPSHYRTVSAAFRRQRGISEQIDIGWQWPINDLWGDKGRDLGAGQGQGPGRYYAVGRLNYSTLERRMTDSVVGVEYEGCCWIGRVVLQRSNTGITNSGTRILFQLELIGFSRIGASPLETLRTNVPRYQFLREKITSPSRFTTYD
ncbi:MAG: LPS biosynthesis protein [Polaromonas sp. 39-63-203]|uniref:LPS-assembly protein LptD n=1 Tax=Polaromonas sp. TaxID=1869339 RepID=UPI000BC8D06B|nr:LPS-assembly protein LptD [Polaromonas sp.]OYY51535.1 MAG: LPS biosynthesis protein [Polaromonas sp. 35-63-240]OYZ82943.1 MAG: LPS biosynthesis protein [Polaromonas sp. 24-62-144]OZA96379.1 MAG: LPS biosynthesis protein [Polaromonas sp. 39-63-203]HQS32217.1 LPS-assembly protein LptD [Polaromonas sp.]HQS91168.1 LPS-assembly protein LptD [Polaromonas sp.]